VHTYKGIHYVIKKARDGLLLVIPSFDISIDVDEDFKETDLLSYI